MNQNLCYHGCGQPGIYYVKSTNSYICSKSSSSCTEIKKKNSKSGKKSYNLGNRKTAKEQYDSLSQESKEKMAWNKGKTALNDPGIHSNYTSESLFCLDGRGPHKKILIQERGHCCEHCKNVQWNQKPITLELEHVDGNTRNNIKENLKLLCPNCHAQTDTWRRSKTKGTNGCNRKHTTAELIEAITSSLNMHQALNKLGLKWGSYITLQRVLIDNDLRFGTTKLM